MSIIRKSQKSPKPTFVSHIATNGEAEINDEKSGSCFYITLGKLDEMQLEAQVLPGEIVISQLSKVTQYVPYGNDNTGQIGTLFVTNYKVSFVTILKEDADTESMNYGRLNKLIGRNDVALTNITDIFYVSKGRKKKLEKGCIASTSIIPVQCLELHCKDFRIHSFSFENCDRLEVYKMLNTIVHHSFPSRSDLLFVFSFEANKTHSSGSELSVIPDFTSAAHWELELKRLRASEHFKVTSFNAHFALSAALPEFFVIPQSLQESDLPNFKAEAQKGSLPLWSYSYINGCALVRLAYGVSTELYEKMIEFVKGSHPKKRKPEVINLGDGRLPSLRELQLSYERLRDHCMPSTSKDLWNSDLTWLSCLENCQWLQYVSAAISIAYEVVEKMSFESRSVVMREKNHATDYSPVISSLAQLMMDAASRTILGFQTLVEKEWVALGHRFADRCGIVYQNNAEESPLFLLFLDCVWQLLQQFPSSFEFSEIYLTSLWDSIGLAMFRNFIFNGPRHRSDIVASTLQQRSPQSKSGSESLMSVWDWENQFSAGDIALFTNPLYVAHEQIQEWQNHDGKFADAYRRFTKPGRGGNKTGSLSPKQTIDARKLWRLPSIDVSRSVASQQVLRPRCRALQIKFWEYCYLRWLTPIQIVGGGMPAEFLAQNLLMSEIRTLQDEIMRLELVTKTAVHQNARVSQRKKPVRPTVKVTRNMSECISSSYPFSPMRPYDLSIIPVVSPAMQQIDGFALDDPGSSDPNDEWC